MAGVIQTLEEINMVGPRCREAVSALGIYNSLQQFADTPLDARQRIPTKMRSAFPPTVNCTHGSYKEQKKSPSEIADGLVNLLSALLLINQQ